MQKQGERHVFLNLTDKNMLMLGVTVEYTCHVDTAISTATSYAKTDDVIYE